MRKAIKVIQRDARDCGICALLSIIKYYGGNIPLEKLRMDTYTSKNGTTAYHLIKAANSYGFDATGYHVENELYENKIPLPVIAHFRMPNNLEHFVVVYKVNKEVITIMDPAIGILDLKIKKFKSLFTNKIITFTVKHEIINLKDDTTLLTMIKNILVANKRIIINILVSSFLFTVLTIASSFFIKTAMYAINTEILYLKLKYVFIIFGFFTIIKLLFYYYRNYYLIYLNKNIDISLYFPFIKHITYLPSIVINSYGNGEITTRINELNTFKDDLCAIIISSILDLFLAVCSLIIIFCLSKIILLIILISITLYFIITKVFNNYTYQKIKENINKQIDFNNSIIEIVECCNSIKNLKKEDYFLNNNEIKSTNFFRHTFLFKLFINNINSLKTLIIELCLLVVNVYGLLAIYKGNFDLINLLTINSLIVYAIEPLKNTIDILPKYSEMKAIYEKIRDFYYLKEENLTYEKEYFKNGDIKINNISFSYDKYHQNIKNFSTLIKMNKLTLLKGKSGIGKSTICKLLYGLIKPDAGYIMIDGINILDYKTNTLRSNIIYVSQDETLFQDTIKNNLTLDNKINNNYFNQIIKLCHIDEIVDKKPLRYETMILPDAANLSGGEKQRIILARALLSRRKIILLDESLSEVPGDLEKDIISNLKELNKTIIYVTHKNVDSLFEQVIYL